MKRYVIICSLLLSVAAQGADYSVEFTPGAGSVGNEEVSSISSSKISDFASAVLLAIQSTLANFVEKNEIPSCLSTQYLSSLNGSLVCVNKDKLILWTGNTTAGIPYGINSTTILPLNNLLQKNLSRTGNEIIIPADGAGTYEITLEATASSGSNTVHDRSFGIRINGAGVSSSFETNNYFSSHTTTVIKDLVANDKISFVYINGAIITSTISSSNISVKKLQGVP